jgi:hypothetical protein
MREHGLLNRILLIYERMIYLMENTTLIGENEIFDSEIILVSQI